MRFKVLRANQTQLLEDSEQGALLRQSMKRTLRLKAALLTLGFWAFVPLSWFVDGFRADSIPILLAPIFFWWEANIFIKGLDESVGKSKWKGKWPFRRK